MGPHGGGPGAPGGESIAKIAARAGARAAIFASIPQPIPPNTSKNAIFIENRTVEPEPAEI